MFLYVLKSLQEFAPKLSKFYNMSNAVSILTSTTRWIRMRKKGNVGKLKFENRFCPAKLCAQSAPFELNLLTLELWLAVNEKLRKCVKINGPILFK